MWDQDSESGYGTDELTILPVVADPLYIRQPLRPCDQTWDATPGDVLLRGFFGSLAMLTIISITLIWVL